VNLLAKGYIAVDEKTDADCGLSVSAFVASLEAAVEEGRRVGFATLDEVEADVLAAIKKVRARRG
jgi:hypothetical protein